MNNKGSILLTAIVFLAVIMSMTMAMFESTCLQIKMTQRFKYDKARRKQAENKIKKLEAMLEETGQCDFPNCRLLQFVPDAFYQYEVTGVHYYELKADIHAVFAMRKKTVDNLKYEQPVFNAQAINRFSSYPVVGPSPWHKGVRVYVNVPKGDDNHTVIQAFQIDSADSPTLIYEIDEKTYFGTPTLWHEYLIVEKPWQNRLALYDARTGEKKSEGVLRPDPTMKFLPMCLRSPLVWMRQSREKKRKIIVTRHGEVWSTELAVDFDRLGRRTAVFNVSTFLTLG